MRNMITFKRLLFLTLFIPGFAFISAQVLTGNSTYKISSYYAQRNIGVLNSSLNQNADVVTYTNTGSNSQRWLGKYDSASDSYSFLNEGSERNLYFYILNEGVIAKQGVSFIPIADKWKIEPVNNPSYPGCYYIYNVSTTSDGKRLYLEVPVAVPIATSEGVSVQGWTDPQNGTVEPRRLWKFEKVATQTNAPTLETVHATFQAFKLKYYKPHLHGYVLNAPGFWSVAEMIEILLDAFETTGHQEYQEMFYKVYENFYKTQGDKNGDWMNNPYNDDIAWIVIACARAHILFNDQKFLPIAKTHFDRMYSRALLPHGGLRWKERDPTAGDGSNSCINGPAQIAAMYLGKILNDASYFVKAKSIYDYQYRVLYDANSGRVYDSALGDVVTNTWASTYNQGTFLGANMMHYEYTGDPKYLTAAGKVASFTKNTMYGNSVMNNESGRDLDGFKGILMRYLRKYIVDYQQTTYIPWLHLNAKVAYNNRNSEGIIGTLWGTKTPEANQDVFAASTAVSLMVNTPLSQNITKLPFERIEAEDFDYISGIIAEDCPEGTENLGNIQNLEYVGYMNVDFGTKIANKVLFRVSSADTGGTIEVRLGHRNGTLIGSVEVPATANWQSYITITCNIENLTGLQHIYLVFKGEGYVANLNWFYFLEQTTDLNQINTSYFKVFPSVVKRGEKVNFPAEDHALLQVISSTGKIVFEKRIQGSDSFFTNNLSSGMYILRLRNDDKVKLSKFIVR